MSTLKKHGLERFDPGEPTEDGKPQKFDPNLHEATFMAKVEGKEDGDIMHVQSKGFILNGRVLRVGDLPFLFSAGGPLTADFPLIGRQGWRRQELLNEFDYL